MILSVVSGVFLLLVVGAAGIGAGTAATLQARFAAVDLAEPDTVAGRCPPSCGP